MSAIGKSGARSAGPDRLERGRVEVRRRRRPAGRRRCCTRTAGCAIRRGRTSSDEDPMAPWRPLLDDLAGAGRRRPGDGSLARAATDAQSAPGLVSAVATCRRPPAGAVDAAVSACGLCCALSCLCGFLSCCASGFCGRLRRVLRRVRTAVSGVVGGPATGVGVSAWLDGDGRMAEGGDGRHRRRRRRDGPGAGVGSTVGDGSTDGDAAGVGRGRLGGRRGRRDGRARRRGPGLGR